MYLKLIINLNYETVDNSARTSLPGLALDRCGEPVVHTDGYGTQVTDYPYGPGVKKPSIVGQSAGVTSPSVNP